MSYANQGIELSSTRYRINANKWFNFIIGTIKAVEKGTCKTIIRSEVVFDRAGGGGGRQIRKAINPEFSSKAWFILAPKTSTFSNLAQGHPGLPLGHICHI